MDLQRIEKALAYALEGTLGKNLRPLYHKGIANSRDVEAIVVLKEIREELGIRTAASVLPVVETRRLEDL